jgi:2-polyprenyl-3-methyl-5-hydroxy-6-metoxy-1,4-benzoquinol methylase
MSDRTASYWGDFHAQSRPKLSWLEASAIVEEVNRRVTGHPKVNPYEWFKSTSKSNFRNALIVGCGTGELERDLLKMGLFENAIGIDIAPKSISKAADDARSQGLTALDYRVFDLDKDDYASLGTFDLIIVNMVAHHVSKLDTFFASINSMLRTKESRVILNEYIGPNRFQQSKSVQSIINSLMSALDDSLKVNHLTDGKELRLRYEITPISHFLANDPSEAIRSSELLNYTNKYLNVISRADYGGAINHMLLTGIIQNFENQYPDGQILKLLMRFEDILEQYKVISSDFTFIVAGRKPRNFFEIIFS